MSRIHIVRFLVSVIFMLSCLSGCQQQSQERKKDSSYIFVDTTKHNIDENDVSGTAQELPAESLKKENLAKISTVKVDQRALRIKDVLSKSREKYMTVTAYCPCAKCCGWKMNRHGNPVYNYGSQRGRSKRVGYTSTGIKADIGTIAADVRAVPYGTKIYIPGYGFGEVKDTGGRLKGNHIDLFFHSHTDAIRWGVKRLRVAVWSANKH
jgi:3D (Asp-Asp-Asp) domain-containing protein